jgi:hypothetical protein
MSKADKIEWLLIIFVAVYLAAQVIRGCAT